MVQVQQRVLSRIRFRTRKTALALAAVAVIAAAAPPARRFYPDDPLWKMPLPRPVERAKVRKLSDYYDFFANTFAHRGEMHSHHAAILADAVNTLGEVPDSAWFTNRHGRHRMSLEELQRGPGNQDPPSMDGPWTVLSAKTEGITPGFTIEDVKGRRYLLKMDPLDYPELASGADVVGSKFFYAIGYFTPENYSVHFPMSQLVPGPKARILNEIGKPRPMTEKDLRIALKKVPRDSDDRCIGLASRFIPGDLLGPFRYESTRADDPNDVVPHERRRDLRGLYVFGAWLAHNDIKSLNSLDSLVKEGDLSYIRHYLIDFGASLGSDSFTAKSPRGGHANLFHMKEAVTQAITFGAVVPDWMRADYPDIRGVGRFESKIFDPETWQPNYPNAAFEDRLPDDEFWAAKIVMSFTDQDIRAIVGSAGYTDPRAVDWISRCLSERRDKIGRAYFAKVLPLDNFAVRNEELTFNDLAVDYKFRGAVRYEMTWSTFDNETGLATPIAGATTPRLPAAAMQGTGEAYYAARIRSGNSAKSVGVYVRRNNGAFEVVGIERTW